MKRNLIAAAVLSFISVAAFATGTSSTSSSTSGGSTTAAVIGFGHFTATDAGAANGHASATAGSGYGVTGNTTNATTSHINTSQAGGFGFGGSTAGGLSGAPLLQPSTECLGQLYRLTKGRIPLIGCGGVASGADAYAKIRAGASLVQIYTGLIYEGPGLAKAIVGGLARLLREAGFSEVKQAVGAANSEGITDGANF